MPPLNENQKAAVKENFVLFQANGAIGNLDAAIHSLRGLPKSHFKSAHQLAINQLRLAQNSLTVARTMIKREQEIRRKAMPAAKTPRGKLLVMFPEAHVVQKDDAVCIVSREGRMPAEILGYAKGSIKNYAIVRNAWADAYRRQRV